MYRIYIVEDDEMIARSMKRHLEGWDYEARCASDFFRYYGGVYGVCAAIGADGCKASALQRLLLVW